MYGADFPAFLLGHTVLILVFKHQIYKHQICVLWNGKVFSENEKCTTNGTYRAQYGRRKVCDLPRCVCAQEWALEGDCTYGHSQLDTRFPPQPPQKAERMQRHAETSA